MVAGKVQHEDKIVLLGNMDHKSPEIVALNPAGQVPFITVDGVPFVESAAILRYLCQSHSSLAKYYSNDPEQAANIDATLDWNATVFRPGILFWLLPYVLKVLRK